MTASFRPARLPLIAFVALTCLLVSHGAMAEDQPAGPRRLLRLDGLLRAAAMTSQPKAQRIIIRVKPGGHDAMRRLLTSRGAAVLADHPSLDALTAVVQGEDLLTLADRSDVLSISADAVVGADGQLLGSVTSGLGGVVRTLSDTVDNVGKTVVDILDPGKNTAGPAVSPRVVRQTLGVSNAWSGRGVGVAIVDSGLEMSAEFQGRVSAFYDFTDGRSEPAAPSDAYGHGTHVAGIIGGSGALSARRDYRGLAPDVRFVVLKVLDENGAGYTSDVIRAIDFAVANRSRLHIDVINLSLGHPIFEPASTDPLVQAVERASKAGLIVVAAAGNLGKNPTTGLPGYAGITSPGNAPSAVTVGALQTNDTVSRADDRIPDYSSAGPTWYDAIVKPDILAPGHNIIAAGARHSTIYTKYPQLRADDPDYIRLSGTSMATAVTSGVVALLLEAHESVAGPDAPALTPNTVKGVLEYSAFDVRNDLGLEYDMLRQGAGGLNGAGAIALASAVDTTAAPGSTWLIPAPTPWTLIGNDWIQWRQGVIWGSAVIWGSTLPVNQMAWGNAVIWGSTTTWGSAVIWGSNIVWDDPQAWSNAVIWGSDTIDTSNGTAVIWGSNSPQ